MRTFFLALCLWLGSALCSPAATIITEGAASAHAMGFGSGLGPADPFFANVQILMHGYGTNGSATIIDSSSFHNTLTANSGAQISTTQWKWNGSSIHFNGTSSSVSLPTLAFSTVPWTVEAWVFFDNNITYVDANGQHDAELIGTGGNSAAAGPLEIDFYSGASPGPPIGMLVNRANAHTIANVPVTMSLNIWYYVAVTKDSSSNVRVFVNGTQVGTTANDTTSILTIDYDIGASGNPGFNQWFPGYMQDVRITIGTARYTSNFTPPTRPLPNH